MLIHLIADYGINDLAFNEVIHRLHEFSPGVNVQPLGVPPFSTLATGFAIRQLSLRPGKEVCIYANTAPRKDKKEAREANAGEGLLYARLKNGFPIIAVNSGYCFSFIKADIEALHHVNVANDGSQFRSRDNYPKAVIGITSGDESFIGEQIDLALIPDVPKNRVAYIDGYGNIKSTIRASEVTYEPGEELKVTLNTTVRTARYAPGTFEVHEGELAFAPGSSGQDGDRYMELFLRGSSARRAFNKARVEQEIRIDRFE
jgi:hypothetical protein